MADFFLLFFIAASLLLAVLVFFLMKRLSSLEGVLSELKFSKSSQSVKYGKMTEQFVPFTKDFPFNPENFRFLGNPIDGIVFEENKIIFAEFKAGSSQLSEKQRRVKELVEKKKVEWFEHRIE
ncbi:MAG: Holliday junction resolvase-like protein [archaeon]